MKITLIFDVEDIHSPESDNIAKWLADILFEEGLRGTFNVTGDKARILESRGRTQVIDSLNRHDIGFHSNKHSKHPTISEYLEECGWEEGVAEVRRRETPGIDAVRDIFGQSPSVFMRPGGSYGPQVPKFAAEKGLAYVETPVELSGEDMFRFANALNFENLFYLTDHEYSETDEFEENLAELDEFLAEQKGRGAEWAGIFCGHPIRVRAHAFSDVLNFDRGKMPPETEWETPTMKSEDEMSVAKDNFRRLAQFLSNDDRIEVATFAEVTDQYTLEPSTIPCRELLNIAESALSSGEIHLGSRISPAEALVGFANILVHFDRHGEYPERVNNDPVLGPTEMPPREPDRSELSWDALVTTADDVINAADSGNLPATIRADNDLIGIGSLYQTFAAAITSLETGTPKKISVSDAPPHPDTGQNFDEIIPNLLDSWTIHKPNLNPSNIVKHTRLQTWTLASARKRNPPK